jgi:hypothetical protein
MAIKKKSGYKNRKSKKERDAAEREFASIPIPEYLTTIPSEEINQDLIFHKGDYVRSGQLASKANDIRKAEALKKREMVRKKYRTDGNLTKRPPLKVIAANVKMAHQLAMKP